MKTFDKLTVSLIKQVLIKFHWVKYKLVVSLVKHVLIKQCLQVFFRTAGPKSLDLSQENISGGVCKFSEKLL